MRGAASQHGEVTTFRVFRAIDRFLLLPEAITVSPRTRRFPAASDGQH
jgi:hypothetical protein